jgi:hypothetical protein
VAVASRDARLCAGAPRGDRAACEALVLRDEAKCGGDARCARLAARWKNALAAADQTGAALTTRAKLVLHGADGTPDPGQIETDLSSELSRGIVVTLDFDGTRFEIGVPQELGATTFAPPPTTRARVALDVLVAGEKGPQIERAEIAVPGGSTLVLPGVKWDGKLAVTKLDAKRGGDAALKMEGKITGGSRAYAVVLDVTTFVRDVVRSPAAGVPKKK